MNLVALEIPENPRDLAPWLERHLVGLDLGALVAELEAVHGPAIREEGALSRLLGTHEGAVLDRGLSTLPPAVLRQLLRQPRLLLELQDRIAESGGEHWSRLASESGDLTEPLTRGQVRLKEITRSAREDPPGDRPLTDSVARPRIAWYRRPWLVSLATAASVLAMVAVYQQIRPPGVTSSGWGWSRPGALPHDVSAPVYLDRLADAAEDWFRKRPEDPVSFARRISEFRQGCSVLILSDHPPLSETDEAWLINKCRAWASKLDGHLAALEAGENLLRVRDAADETVRKLIQALRERAESLS